MEQVTLHIPHMYGDHHVMYVKDLLHQLDGVEDVIASAAFHEVAVTFDPAVTSAADIEAALAAEGYPAGPPNGRSTIGLAGEAVPRHALAFSEAYTTETPDWELPEWRASGPLPCPGFEYRAVRDVHPADE